MSLQALKPSQVANWLEIMFAAGRNPMLHGEPGLGKSEVTSQTADKLCSGLYPEYKSGPRPWFIEVRAAQVDAVDLRGLPEVRDGLTHWVKPAFLPTDPRGGIIFLDEINRGAEIVQNALFQLCDQGVIGDYRMPERWHIASAVNDKDVGARKMSAALTRRFVHADMATDLDDVVRFGASQNWHPMVTAFLRSFPGSLHKFDPAERVSPNPRAWSFVSYIMKQTPKMDMLPALVAGAVGEGAAIEFIGFVQLWSTLPPIENIFTDPLHTPVPSGASSRYAISAAIARRVTEKTLSNAILYLDRMPVEYNIASVTEAAMRNPDLTGCSAYTNWMLAHADVTLEARV